MKSRKLSSLVSSMLSCALPPFFDIVSPLPSAVGAELEQLKRVIRRFSISRFSCSLTFPYFLARSDRRESTEKREGSRSLFHHCLYCSREFAIKVGSPRGSSKDIKSRPILGCKRGDEHRARYRAANVALLLVVFWDRRSFFELKSQKNRLTLCDMHD